MKIKPVMTGLATNVPGLWERFRGGTGGTASARYCYSVWMRHLVANTEIGMVGLPRTVAELGPGDSIGIGLAALISGVERYFALDLIQHTTNPANIRIFDELVELFHQRAAIPDGSEFPRIIPHLESNVFPEHILTAEHLQHALAPKRIARLRTALQDIEKIENLGGDSPVTYAAPWTDVGIVREGAVDLIISQAVLEHIDDLNGTFHAMKVWLKTDGLMSHSIDFGSHGITEAWNGQWALPAWLWKIIRGKRAYLLNREPVSTHLRLLTDHGFTLLKAVSEARSDGIPREKLAKEFRGMGDEDLNTRTIFLVAKKSDFPEATA
jgi:hypothetical protein